MKSGANFLEMTYIFDTEIAARFGVNEAILIQNFIYWIQHNEANEKHFKEGRFWTYNTAEALAKLFPFWTVNQVRHLLGKLVDAGVLVKGNFNLAKTDRTLWYGFADAYLEGGMVEIRKLQNPSYTNASSISQNCKMEIANLQNDIDIYKEIANNKPDSKQDNKPAKRGTTENLCLFINSKFADFNVFVEQFKAPEFANLDMWHYYNVVADWSASNGAKKRDWIATTRNWIRSDKERGKLHTVQRQGVALDPTAIQYLQEMGEGLF